MSNNADLAAALDAMTASRRALVAAIEPLTREDMETSRPGSWSVGGVLHHVAEYEVIYLKILARLRGQVATDVPVAVPEDGSDAVAQLARTRAALLEMADGIDDATLHRLSRVGEYEFSCLSVIEKNSVHDEEHVAQIAELFGPSADVGAASPPSGLG